MPVKRPGEDRSTFIKRYMESEHAKRRFPDRSHRLAVALSTFSESELTAAACELVLMELERIGRAKKAVTVGAVGAGVGAGVGAALHTGNFVNKSRDRLSKFRSKVKGQSQMRATSRKLLKMDLDKGIERVQKGAFKSSGKNIHDIKVKFRKANPKPVLNVRGAAGKGLVIGGLGTALLAALASKEIGQRR